MVGRWGEQAQQYLETQSRKLSFNREGGASPLLWAPNGSPQGSSQVCPRAEPVCAVIASQLMVVPLGDDLPVGPTL